MPAFGRKRPRVQRRAWGGTLGRSKYRAVPTVCHGFRFASKREAARYGELLLLGMAGEIRNLELQPRFPLLVGGVKVGDYVADFRYQECRLVGSPAIQDVVWRDVVEDVKGVRTPVYRMKAKHMLAQYGITIREVR